MLLQAMNISKHYGTTVILSGISIQIQERERIGLVGVNGAGKSTFLQIISGEMSYDGGEIHKSKDVRIGYLAQNSGLHSNRTIEEEMRSVYAPLLAAEQELRELETMMADPKLLADEKKYAELMNRYAARSDWFRDRGGFEMNSRIRSVLHGMGFGEFAPDTRVNTLSGGQKTRLALAKMLLEQPDLLMLDEPTNHLDIKTLEWLEDYLRGYPGAILVVSHDRYFLDSLVTAIYEIERNSSKRYTVNYTRFIELKAADFETQMKQYEKQQDEIARMEDFVQRNIVRATTTKRAQSRRKALERMERIDKPLGDLKRASFSFQIEQPTGKDVLQVDRLTIAYEGKPALLRGVSFELSRGETVALIGPNGVGKSSLLKVLMGGQPAAFGTYHWGANVRLGYYDQEQTGLNPNNTVLDEVWNAYRHLEEVRIRTVLGRFLFSGDDVSKKIASLSGGEKARVALAKLMLLNANVLILDEPTNHLDLFSKEVLEDALIDYEGTILFISHDRYFLNKMSERMLELAADGVTTYLGNYDDYVEKKAELAEMLAEQGRVSAAGGVATRAGTGAAGGVSRTGTGESAQYAADKQAKRDQRSRQRRVEQLEAGIAQLEVEIAALESKLVDPAVYNNYILVQETQSAIDAKKAELMLIYTEWESLIG
jgi:ATP-binding cassette subfamily F protein 3